MKGATTDIEAALNPVWRALIEVDRLTVNPSVRMAVGKARDAIRKIEREARDAD